MKIRSYRVIKCDKVTITVCKDNRNYKSTYSVGVYNEFFSWKITCPDRKIAKEELIRKLQIYSNLKITEIIRGLF